MNKVNYDIAIIGGGIVGLATAYKLQRRFPTISIVVLEKEPELAFHQTGRNSGVIHSGLYYKPGSYRAKNCVDGRKQLIAFSKLYNIKHDICGKIVLATNKEEESKLHHLKENGEKNGLKGLKILYNKDIKTVEPFAEGVAALVVPQSGIIDYKGVTNKLAHLITAINPKSKVLVNAEVLKVDGTSLELADKIIKVNHSIFCGGLSADRLAKKDGLNLTSRVVGFRGDYYNIKKESLHKVKNLIYPVPNPKFPFLGVHFTRMVDGSVECGPNAVFTFEREGYTKTSFNLKDTLDSLSFMGTLKFFLKHWRFGWKEYRRAFSKRLFVKELNKLVPSIGMDDLEVGKCGVRATVLSEKGTIEEDFNIIKSKNNIHVLNAPSPAATACLSIADEILNVAINHFNLKKNIMYKDNPRINPNTQWDKKINPNTQWDKYPTQEEIIKFNVRENRKKEMINHPNHYGGEDNPYEAIKVIESWDLNFNLGNVVKYISRAGKKDNIKQDIKKALWYLKREIQK